MRSGREPHRSTRIWLGTYPTPMAGAAYAAAPLALPGAKPDDCATGAPRPRSTSPARPRPARCSPDDIRAAAVAASMAGRPGECADHSYLPQAATTASTSGSEAGGASVSASDRSSGRERRIVDEDDILRMLRLLEVEGMAEGLMMSPPVEAEPHGGRSRVAGGGQQ
ncbi:dehydration-responsive element-binding protein 1F-like [Panicum virgatum]|uniref:dehydration-responsive element-binding protein 1F-like n=1 Tax=Panicum virgatum TaxID=38727 RepID=UPI0019D617BC|nr:dehydration-responsive element-binding protein 1F-like [Panicum virgatum]